ncbi:MAG TPA: VanZ family protein [Nitrospirae bacterium]|nr:hypothetical protein BMS3Abin06_01627 [bacterium BMS3Abin06]HDH13401.1 VanZ family protein [Nitrospirota bacterium]HDZ02184.1 VanZ family protein [Nitrospirota bacterium]
MNPHTDTEKGPHGWSLKAWLWVVLCSIAIFSTVPVARDIQKFIYDTAGREFFTYFVLSAGGSGLAALLYFLVFRLKTRNVSQYLWLFICAGLYVYFTLQLGKQHPEEAIHLLEFGILSCFVFKALSYRIHDRTVYITAVLIVLFIGTTDEFIQWLTPQRVWDYRDIGTNTVAGGIFMLAVWKGIKPEIISGPVKKISIKMLAGTATLNLLFLGLCLSNTPDVVNRYTAVFDNLSRLRSEEVMTEYGYKYKDPEIGTFYSRLTLEKLKEIDLINGEKYGNIVLQKKSPGDGYENLIRIYTPYTNPFLYEFLKHISQRDRAFENLAVTNDPGKKIKISNIAYRENLLLETYFKNTLKHSGSAWSGKITRDLQETASLWKGDYTSDTGKIITSFSLKTAWLYIVTALAAIWISAEFRG